ncbi:hypothetical protein Nepgr_014445 [Nepenthes gracilis]|uniref:Uncharacterized protein n=1 Tax=Nepenthes gracilis TaxID=150966 RepID=A0AAD3SKU9_NEPGR|nr:hypothetical protein Nepgr_014445 [Nepenthes gracilis]
MNAPAASRSRLFMDPFDQRGHGSTRRSRREANRSHRSLSKRMPNFAAFCSRSLRARQRRIFLKTYKLSSIDDNSTQSNSQKLIQAASKVKSVMISFVAAARMSSLRRCLNPNSINWQPSATSPREEKINTNQFAFLSNIKFKRIVQINHSC